MKEEDDAPNGGRCRRDGRAREGTVDPCSRHVFVITYRRGSKNEMGRGDGDGEEGCEDTVIMGVSVRAV
jgi:hypothetical protein